MNPLCLTEFSLPGMTECCLPVVQESQDVEEQEATAPFASTSRFKAMDIQDLLNIQDQLIDLWHLAKDTSQEAVQHILAVQMERIPCLRFPERISHEELQRYIETLIREAVDEIWQIASSSASGLVSLGEKRCVGQGIQTLGVLQGDMGIIRFLHEKGVNWHLVDGTGKTAWQIAIDENYQGLVVLFLHMLGPDGIVIPINGKTFLSYFAETNPALVYEMWNCLPLDGAALLTLREQNPFFSLKDRLYSLQEKEKPLFSEVKEELASLLHDLHTLNRRMAIPRSFYTIHATLCSDVDSLDLFLDKLCLRCSSHELLELVSLINQNYFCGSNWLLYAMYKRVKFVWPSLKQYVTEHFLTEARTDYTPSLTSRGIALIVNKKMADKGVQDLFFPGVVHTSKVAQVVGDFFRSQKEKGAFLIHFLPGTTSSHYAPCLMKREFSPDAIRCFYTDSLISQENCVLRPLSVFQAVLQNPPCFIDLYCSSQQRQFGWVGCIAFSISDIFESVLHGDEIFDHLRENRTRPVIVRTGDSGNTSLCHSIGAFPLPMMKLVQSLSAIQHLTCDTSRFFQKGRERSLKEYVDMRTYVARFSGETHAKQRNLGCLIKYGKYFERVLKQVIEEEQSKSE